MFERMVCAALACCCTAAIIGCIPVVQQASSTSPEVDAGTDQEAGTPVDSSREIEGQWDIVSFEDYEPQRLTGANRTAYADFDGSRVSLRIECNQSGAVGRVAEGIFRSSPVDMPQTVAGCGPEREARDAALFGFFRTAPTVEQLADGRLQLRSGTSTLLLQRPGERRLDFLPTREELVGEWRLLTLSRTIDGKGYSTIGLSDVPGRIVFTKTRAGYSRCPQYDFDYAYDAEGGRLEKRTSDALPALPVDCAELTDPGFGGPDMPVVWDAMRVLHGSPLVEKSGNDTLLLSSGDLGLLLTR